MVFGLTACTPSAPDPSPSPSATASPSETPSPTSTPSAEPLTIVGCETLLTIEQARSFFAADTEFLGERAPTVPSGLFPLAEIDDTLAAAAQATECAWGIPNSDGVFTLHVAEVTADQRSTVEAALTDAGFTDVMLGTVTGFEKTGENEVGTTAATHLFTGNVWIMSNANALTTTGPVANTALDALRAANPELEL